MEAGKEVILSSDQFTFLRILQLFFWQIYSWILIRNLSLVRFAHFTVEIQVPFAVVV